MPVSALLRRFLFAILLGAAFATPTFAQQVLKSEPPPGTLQTGTSVLVDDGSCPAGQILKLTRVGPMSDRAGGFRKRECIRKK